MKLVGVPRPSMLLAAGALAVIAAIAFALTDPVQRSTTYEFQPSANGGGVAPLALARAEPAELHVVLPCVEEFPVSTFRSMHLGLWWSRDGSIRSPVLYTELGHAARLEVGFGTAVLSLGSVDLVAVPVSHHDECEVSASYGSGVWTLDVDGDVRTLWAPAPRIAEAAIEGPAMSDPATLVSVTTHDLGTSPSSTQIAWFVVAIGAAAVVAVGLGGRRAGRDSSAVGRFRAPDVAVMLALATWLLVIPAGFDDAWVVGIQRSYSSHGDFSGILETTAVAPIGHWLHWLGHFWSGVSGNALWLRLPVLAVGIAMWLLIRRLLARYSIEGGGVRWLVAATFIVGFGAWGVTWRPEPVLAILLVASVLLAQRVVDGARGWVVAGWMLVIALGVTAHPAGALVAAPLVAALGPLARWARGSREKWGYLASAGALLISATLLLLFVDSGLGVKLDAIESSRLAGHDRFLLDEPVRYRLLGEAPFGSALRVGAVLLMGLGAVSFLWRKIAKSQGNGIPGASLVIGLGALAITPSKWAWHFGGLLGLTAVVVGVEAQMRSQLRGAAARVARTVWWLAIVGLLVAAGSAQVWTAFDLRSFDWGWSSPTWTVASLATVGLVVFAVRSLGWRVLDIGVVAVTAGLVVGTASALVVDTLRVSGWTFTAQNVASIWGGAGCGLGDELIVPRPEGIRRLEPADHSEPSADRAAAAAGFDQPNGFAPASYPTASINTTSVLEGLESYGSWIASSDGPHDANVGSHRSPWFVVGDTELIAVAVMGRLGADGAEANAVAVQWSSADGPVHATRSGYFLDWQLEFFERPSEAEHVRVLASDQTTSDASSWVAVTDPLAVETATLGAVVGDKDLDVLVSSPLGLYLPCVDVPVAEGGVVPVPDLVVNMWPTPWQTAFAVAMTSDRYFVVPQSLDPPARDLQIGAHLGDPKSFVFVSQEYLTGLPSRSTGSFVPVP